LHSLFALCTDVPEIKDRKKFNQRYKSDIRKARQKDASSYDIRRGKQKLDELREITAPYLLRRLKKDYLQDRVPPNLEFDAWIRISPKQRNLSKQCLEKYHALIQGYVNREKACVLPVIEWLQKIYMHPLLYTNGEDYKEKMRRTDVDQLIKDSPKLNVLVHLLLEWVEAGHKTLVFSHSTRMLDIMEYVLSEKGEEGIHACRLDGQTSQKRRKYLVDDINSGNDSLYNVMLLSIKAGGEGLTLTGASKCVVYDPTWSQAESDQAVARISRPGQTRECESIHLLAAGTIEEKVRPV